LTFAVESGDPIPVTNRRMFFVCPYPSSKLLPAQASGRHTGPTILVCNVWSKEVPFMCVCVTAVIAEYIAELFFKDVLLILGQLMTT
jgi:hypothetical protein